MSTIAETQIIRTERAGGFLRRVLRSIAQYRMYQATLTELQNLGDVELEDLGLERSQLRSVAYEAAYRA